MEFMIKGGYIVTEPGRVVRDGVLVVEDGEIIDVGGREIQVKYRGYEALDAGGKLVIPGLINTHTHAAMTLLRGYADDMLLDEWLNKKIWPLEANLRPEDVYIGTMLACLEMMRSGTTTFADMYFYMGRAAEAVKETGLRALISHGMIELGDKEKGEREIMEAEKLIRNYHGGANGRLRVMFGPHAPYTCSPDYLVRVKELAVKHDVMVNIHVAETRGEAKQIEKRFGVNLGGKGVIHYLDSLNFLYSNVLAAHTVWVSPGEINVLFKRGVKVSHNPVSNLKIACGIAPVQAMLDRGVTVSLGTDGAASNNTLDMFETMKVAALIHKNINMDPTVLRAEKVFEMATVSGAKSLGLEGEIGTLKPGKKADIVILDLKKPRLTPLHNVFSHLVYAARGEDVETVIVDGRILMEEGEIKTVNEEEVLRKASETAKNLVERSKG